MGRVYKPIAYKPLPAGAEVFTPKGQCFARWTDRRGRTRTAPVEYPDPKHPNTRHAGEPRIVVESSRFVAEYRGPDGMQTVPTGTHGKSDPNARFTVYGPLDENGRTQDVPDNLGPDCAARGNDVSNAVDEGRESLSFLGQKRATGFEPATFSLEG
jgi:hypothetical protein